MLETLASDGNGCSAEELTAFRELCKDYEAPSSLQLEALESRIQALEGLAATTGVKFSDTIRMGP